MKLIIVESPSKCKTIQNYLGKDYLVDSSYGHIRDLKITGTGGFGVDVENNFTPSYRVLKDKLEIVKKLKKELAEVDHVYLATDPDREGEAISWHLSQVLELNENNSSRIVFNEVTKKAILGALANDRSIDMNLVRSQESRRILDRIIGFRLSTLLQQKIGSKSAGRVQSIALKLIVDREKEIEAFDKVEFWDIFANLESNKQAFKAKFVGTTEKKMAISSEIEATEIINSLGPDYTVSNIVKKLRKRSSKPPFITSTLQQDAGAKYNYNAKRVMMIAQRLYEGLELENERVGLITYMRTDSIRLSDDFISSCNDFIVSKFGKDYYNGPKKSTKTKNVQDAHEAIHPTDISRTPESIKKYLSLEEYKIYTLIYNRALASLMKDATIEDTKIDITNNNYLFNISGEKVVDDGFLKVYEETSIDDVEEVSKVPKIELNEKLSLIEINKEQKFTSPPYRYTEARLIRKMEELGIGRPSTYAIIMETLKARGYVQLAKKMFTPTSQGILTSEQLDLFFDSIINIKYTADMESNLDKIAEGKTVWYNELKKFYLEFVPLVENARDNMVKIYPKITDEFCPDCGLPLFIRRGPFGEFTACSGFPHCKYIKKEPKKEPVKTGIKCPVCKDGEIVERVCIRGRTKGKLFYACDQYPTCKTTYSGIPIENDFCEICNSAMIMENDVRRCGNEKCKSNIELKKQKKLQEQQMKEKQNA